MKGLMRAYRALNLISIDVACGAVVCAAFFADIFSVHLRVYGFASLGLTVWIIYTLDHLLDARRLDMKALTNRHQFHQQYFRIMIYAVMIAVALDIYCILNIRRPIFSWGAGLAALVALYLLFQRWLSPFKEVMAAILYSSGVLLPALSLTSKAISVTEGTIILTFLLTAFINLILFSMYDEEKDFRHTQPSFVISFGRRNAKTLLIVLFLLQLFFLGGLVVAGQYKMHAVILGVMNAVLFILFVYSDSFKIDEGYRLLGDIIFLFPLPYLVIYG